MTLSLGETKGGMENEEELFVGLNVCLFINHFSSLQRCECR